MPLRDRRFEFIEYNKTICQENCYFSEYDKINKIVKCSCIGQESAYNFTDMKINETRISEQFDDIKYFLNLNIIFCYKELFCKDGLLKNVINFLIFPFIILHIICFKKFFCDEKEKLDSKIKNIFWSIKNWNLVVKHEKERQNKSEKLNILTNSDKIKNKNAIKSKKRKKIIIKMINKKLFLLKLRDKIIVILLKKKLF